MSSQLESSPQLCHVYLVTCACAMSLMLPAPIPTEEAKKAHCKAVPSGEGGAADGGQGQDNDQAGSRGASASSFSFASACALLLLMNMGGLLLELSFLAERGGWADSQRGDLRPTEPHDAFCVHAGQRLVRMHLAPHWLTNSPAKMREARLESLVLLLPAATLLISLVPRFGSSTALKHILASSCAAVIALHMALQVRASAG